MIPGTVRVTAVVDGAMEGVTAQVDVAARDWTNIPIDSAIGLVPSTLPVRPRGFDGQFGRITQMLEFDPQSFAFISDNGPNHSLEYQTAVPFRWIAEIEINYTAMSDSSEFWLLQPEVPQAGQCTREFLSIDLPPLIEAHEGLGFEPNSHVATYHGSLRQNLPPLGEQIAGRAPDLTITMAFVHGTARSESVAITDGLLNNLTFTCEFTWFQ